MKVRRTNGRVAFTTIQNFFPRQNDNCETRLLLWDEMEQCFASPEIQQRVRDMQEESAIELSNQSKERALVGEVISTVALADQISREFNVSDQGIDMEIEFNDDAHEATGAKLTLQLKMSNQMRSPMVACDVDVAALEEPEHRCEAIQPG